MMPRRIVMSRPSVSRPGVSRVSVGRVVGLRAVVADAGRATGHVSDTVAFAARSHCQYFCWKFWRSTGCGGDTCHRWQKASWLSKATLRLREARWRDLPLAQRQRRRRAPAAIPDALRAEHLGRLAKVQAARSPAQGADGRAEVCRQQGAAHEAERESSRASRPLPRAEWQASPDPVQAPTRCSGPALCL